MRYVGIKALSDACECVRRRKNEAKLVMAERDNLELARVRAQERVVELESVLDVRSSFFPQILALPLIPSTIFRAVVDRFRP